MEAFLKNTKRFSLSLKTIERYLQWACDFLLLYRVDYYNIKRKDLLKTSGKYYAGDLGLLSSKIGFNYRINTGFRLENLVFLQLLDFGYKVYTYKSKLGKEIDFVAIKNNETFYIQVTLELNDDNYKREVGNLLSIRDGWKKVVIFKTNNEVIKNDGVVRIHIIDFLQKGL
ncbi:MAG: DUF4143 domain-containing protein [Mycoplasmataceae bacterium]|nr:DUF4143 domain-containing protein [Mycoplasmataceae bacterium]